VIRPYVYQQEVIDGAVKLWRGGLRRIAAVLATGAGKTVVFSFIARMCLAVGLPVLVVAHRTELIDQALDKLRQVNPDARLGRMQGTTKEFNAEIVVASVQTASTPGSLALLKTRRWGLIIVDETHHIAAATYLRLLRDLGAYDADGPLVLGVTATLDRSDGLALGEVFEGVVDPTVGLVDLIRHPDGPFLVRPRGIRVRIDDLNLDQVRRVAGDFRAGELGKAMSDAMAPQRIVEAWQEHAKSRPTIAFLPTVALSIEQAAAFNAAGYVAVHLDGETPAGDKINPAPGTRRHALAEFTAGRIDVLCNVNLFTEGTDLPCVSCVILGAPTSSGSRYQQQVGRGLRLHPGKRDCVILDVTGVTKRHKLATMVNLNGADRPEDVPDDLLMYEDEGDEAFDDTEPEDEGKVETVYADGELEHEMIDLFGQSHSAWLRTPGGRWFLPCGQAGFLFLTPAAGGDAGRFDLRYTSTERGHEGAIREDMEIGYAMAAGDEFVAARPMWQAERTAPWRSMPHQSGRTKGEVHDRKMIAEATRLFDPRPL
jgi:superfamily II DNA or RNA helicase